MASSRRRLLHPQVLATVSFLLLAGAVAFYFVATAEPAGQADDRPQGALVRTTTLQRGDRSPMLTVHGTVLPERSVQLRAEVPGELTFVLPGLRPGRFVARGEWLAGIERTDYELAVKQAESALTEARAQLELERGRRKVAREEWEFFLERSPDGRGGDRDLALREPQLAVALARVQRAEAEVETARLNLSRTRIEAPFDAVVVEERIELGQLVGSETALVDLIGSDALRVQASVPSSRLAFLSFPGKKSARGSPARVTFETGAGKATWAGRVTALEPAVDPRGRMARVLILVGNPYPQGEGTLPLLLNTFVDVEIRTTLDDDLLAIPRAALHHDGRVYLYEQDQLRIASPRIVWREADRVFTRANEVLAQGDEVVVSPLAFAVEGMPLRRQEGSPAPPGEREGILE